MRRQQAAEALHACTVTLKQVDLEVDALMIPVRALERSSFCAAAGNQVRTARFLFPNPVADASGP